MTPRVVVANPGGIPDMIYAANALGAAGALRCYVAPFSPTSEEVDTGFFSALGPIGRQVTGQLRRRVVSDAVGLVDRRRAARLQEMALVAGIRAGLWAPALHRLFVCRNHALAAAAASALDRTDTDLIVPARSALVPLERARALGLRTWLHLTFAHHRYSAQLIADEVRARPEFASTGQHPAPRSADARQLDRELLTADEFIVLSSFQRRTYLEAGVPQDRLHLVPLGVDVDMFRPGDHARGDTFVIGFVGQVTQTKGIGYLVAAFEALGDGQARLLVVGRPVGPREPWLREGVVHQPAVPRSTLPQYYNRMDVFVLPSLSEGFGLTALEAMACGVPVIVSENTFGSDIVADGHNGYVVPIRDADAIVDCLRRLKGDETLRLAMGANARATAETYSWDAFGDRLVALVGRQ